MRDGRAVIRGAGVRPGGPQGRAALYAIEGDERVADLPMVAESTLHLITEVLAGTRPLRQLARRATPEVCEGLAPLTAVASPRGPIRPPRVLTTWLQEPASGKAEAGAVIAIADRIQAVAIRLEHHRGRWRCTTIETTSPPR
jgi:hypothetical protein